MFCGFCGHSLLPQLFLCGSKGISNRMPARGPGALLETADFDETTAVFWIGLVEDEIAQREKAQRAAPALPSGRRAMRMTAEDEAGTGLLRPPGE